MRRVLVCLCCAAACYLPRRDELEPTARAAFLEEVRSGYEATLQAALSRMEHDDTFDILVIHGGRDNGSFAAGILLGWEDRPEFDVVTGISSGAILAPFMGVGDEESLRHVFLLHKHPEPDWVKVPGLFFWWPGRPSLLDVSGLSERVRHEIDDRVVEGLVVARAEDRLLLVGATNIDHGALRIFDVGREAKQGRERVHNIVMASTALPILFPPVEVDGELYVDGAVTNAMILGFDEIAMRRLIDMWNERHKNRAVPRIRIWVIVNDRLAMETNTTQPVYLDVALGTVFTLLNAQRLYALRGYRDLNTILNTIPGVTSEFRFIAIPDDHKDPGKRTDLFHEARMQGLAELGLELGRAQAWRTEPPNPEWPE